ncbi:MOSC domain-containing protein [Halalkalibacterium ligniniphilum]|uniref:MOSC domain-containing protein n=1 Tax=Halalkalibacterium ligniniphilum TaxID=1134413 RepID=UPI000376BE54|nr:MOSC domain-containing protein [Halalkalibacterium ligniniphilum]
MPKQYPIQSLHIGQPKTLEYKGKEVTTSIFKKKVAGPVHFFETGVEGDKQADLVNHGGLDKAVCVYPFDHYPFWKKYLGKEIGEAAFGENVTVVGLIESEVRIGDIFQVGEAVVQVSQPRHPCYKLNLKHKETIMPLLVKETGRSGYYLRVLRPGDVSAEDIFMLLERKEKNPTVQEVHAMRFGKNVSQQVMKKMSETQELANGWKEWFSQILEKQ